MAEQDELSLDEETKPARSLHPKLRRFLFCMAVLAVLWLIFGQAFPRAMFSKPAGAPLTKTGQMTEPPAKQQEHPVITRLNTLDERVKNAEAHLARLEEQLATMQAPPPETTPAPAFDPSNLEAQITGLQVDVAALKNAPDLKTHIQQLASLNILGQIKQAVARNAPFAAEQSQLKQLTQEHPRARELAGMLAPFAKEPSPSQAALTAQFDTLVDGALQQAKNGTLQGNLSSLVRIRKVGEPQGADDAAVLARAASQLERGALDGALKELAQLSEPAALVFAPWVQKTQNLLALQDLLDALTLELAANAATLPTPAPMHTPTSAPAVEPVVEAPVMPAAEPTQ